MFVSLFEYEISNHCKDFLVSGIQKSIIIEVISQTVLYFGGA